LGYSSNTFPMQAYNQGDPGARDCKNQCFYYPQTSSSNKINGVNFVFH